MRKFLLILCCISSFLSISFIFELLRTFPIRILLMGLFSKDTLGFEFTLSVFGWAITIVMIGIPLAVFIVSIVYIIHYFKSKK